MNSFFILNDGWNIETYIVLFLWVVVGVCIFLMKLLFGRSNLDSIWCFHKDETGGAYGISFLIVLPFYVLFMCLVFEVTFTLAAKIGSIHAALAAVRTAVVHTAVNHPDDRNGFITNLAEKEAKRAAILAIVPYSSGKDAANQKPSEDGVSYWEAYNDFLSVNGIKTHVRKEYVLARYASAEKRINVNLNLENEDNIDSTNEPWTQSLTATVTYDAPCRLPNVGKLIGGTKKDGAVVITMTTKATLILECPKNKLGFLGVPFPAAVTKN